jgi:phospholipid/cholesterol/gamma-HCH transport system substrate-binding protein
VDGLEPGSDVRVSGIKVGSVLDQTLDPDTYRAEVRFTVRDGVELPADSSASVVSDGLLGGKYLRIVPGGDIDMLSAGDEVMLTQSAISLEDLIGHMVFGQGSSNPGAGDPGAGDPGAGDSGAGNPAGGGAAFGEEP